MQKIKKVIIKKTKNKVLSRDTHLDKKYGVHGTASRSEFELKAQTFILGEILKEEREKANLTQAEMAEKTGTKKPIFQELKMAEPIFNYQLCTGLLRRG